MSDPLVFDARDRPRVYVGPEHRYADRRGWVTLRKLARIDPAKPQRLRWDLKTYPHPKGYVCVLLGVGHPYANKSGLVYLHRLVVMTHLGRKLAWYEHVHHRNEDKSDSSLANLEVLEAAEHGRFHYGRHVGCGAHVCPECRGNGCTHCRQGLVACGSRGSL